MEGLPSQQFFLVILGSGVRVGQLIGKVGFYSREVRNIDPVIQIHFQIHIQTRVAQLGGYHCEVFHSGLLFIGRGPWPCLCVMGGWARGEGG